MLRLGKHITTNKFLVSESIGFTVDIAFVIDAVTSNADTVKTIVNQLLGWPQIAESDTRCGIIKFDDTGDKAEVCSCYKMQCSNTLLFS